MLAHALISGSLAALGAFSIATMGVGANWGSSALDQTLGVREPASERVPRRDSDGEDRRRGDLSVVELGGGPSPRLILVSNRVAALAGIYRAADVALITPLREGMNLVAKEYVAAQDPENPGAFVLSQFAAAATELTGALIANPHESDAVAAALKRAVEMPLIERRERHGPMLRHLLVHDIEHWAEGCLAALAETRRRPSLIAELSAFLRPSKSSTDRRPPSDVRRQA
jgi:hypothetical protein